MLRRIREDIQTVFAKDPAARTLWEVLSYPGLWASWNHRLAHALWRQGFRLLARFVSQLSRFWTGIEIHPGAKIGRGFFIDHGMGVVIGETAEVGENVLLYHGVTLGGTGNAADRNLPRRHPKLGDNVTVGTGTAIIGPVTVGDHVTIGANSLVRHDIPSGATAVGNPARVVKINGEAVRLDKMTDPRDETIAQLQRDIEEMKERLSALDR